ncbi:hypothetical protein COI_0215 [Mannheimia haemolytica serotype A2 str. OVINE]|nr:hypothetical protein COI_0215 [Mannheimia haemolytica serotype A2 str. OVINE]
MSIGFCQYGRGIQLANIGNYRQVCFIILLPIAPRFAIVAFAELIHINCRQMPVIIYITSTSIMLISWQNKMFVHSLAISGLQFRTIMTIYIRYLIRIQLNTPFSFNNTAAVM